ncbi:MAG: hypothetical protein K0Q73_6206 [Paenibacillus sp.]|nr:hypothetical protein [Paenibacillus sp.]
MRIRNHELENFILFLDQQLHLEGTDSRMRTRLKNLLLDRLKLFYEEKIEIGRTYSRLGENGVPVMKQFDGQEVFDIEDETSAVLALNELLNEEFVVDLTEERKQMLVSVKRSILTCSVKLNGKAADDYDRYCEIVEAIHYDG